MPVTPDVFWKPYEATVSSWDEALQLITTTFRDWSDRGSVFAWRGQVDASWALHSSLYRRKLWTAGPLVAPPSESECNSVEESILDGVRGWGLHNGPTGRLSVLAQLAMLQHYGAPTRLLDISFNPLIGLWFAVEQQWDNGTENHTEKDGRIFAIDVSGRLINDDEQRRGWEDARQCPWPGDQHDDFTDWTTNTYAWKPPRLDHRMSAQNGGFLLGGVPSSSKQWLMDSAKPGQHWSTEQVRQCLSVPLTFHKIERSRGRLPDNPSYTIRIKHSAKPDIRRHLQDLFAYRHSTIYPDYSGFALYGTTALKSRP